jgi:hypothetical protein
VKLEALQLALDLGVALGQLRTDEVERVQCLFERKQVLSTPVALKTAGDLLGPSTSSSLTGEAKAFVHQMTTEIKAR